MRNKNAKISDPNSFVTEAGSPERTLYSAKVGIDGSIEVVPSGKENIQDKIESFRDQTDMAYVIKQIMLGNADALNVHPGQYGDFTQMPKSMQEALQLQLDAQKAWSDLPIDIRAKFDHDINRWLVTAGSPEWAEKMFPKDNSGEALVAGESEVSSES